MASSSPAVVVSNGAVSATCLEMSVQVNSSSESVAVSLRQISGAVAALSFSNASSPLEISQWHRVTVVVNASVISVWADSIQIGQSQTLPARFSGLCREGSNSTLIGTRAARSDSFTGDMHSVVIHGHELSQQEISALPSCGIPGWCFLNFFKIYSSIYLHSLCSRPFYRYFNLFFNLINFYE